VWRQEVAMQREEEAWRKKKYTKQQQSK
jgi:hypothetical protein